MQKKVKQSFQQKQRESLLDSLEILIPQLDKVKVVEQLEREEKASSTCFAKIKGFENGNSFKEGMSTCLPFKFTARMHTDLKKQLITSLRWVNGVCAKNLRFIIVQFAVN